MSFHPPSQGESFRIAVQGPGAENPFRRRIENLVESVLGLDRGEVHAGARLRDDFGVDFLDLLELALAMEAELGVQIHDRDLEGVTTVDDLILLADKSLAPARPARRRRRAAGIS